MPDQCLYLILIVNKQLPRGPPVTRSSAPSKYFSPRKYFPRWWTLHSEMMGRSSQGMVSCLTSKMRFNVCSARRREGPQARLFLIDNTCTLWTVPLVHISPLLPSGAKRKTSCLNTGMPLHSGVKMGMSRRNQIRPRLKRPQYQGSGRYPLGIQVPVMGIKSAESQNCHCKGRGNTAWPATGPRHGAFNMYL